MIATLNLDAEHAFQALCPAHRYVLRCRTALPCCTSCAAPALGRHDLRSQAVIRRKHPMTNRQDCRFARPQAARRVGDTDVSNESGSGSPRGSAPRRPDGPGNPTARTARVSCHPDNGSSVCNGCARPVCAIVSRWPPPGGIVHVGARNHRAIQIEAFEIEVTSGTCQGAGDRFVTVPIDRAVGRHRRHVNRSKPHRAFLRFETAVAAACRRRHAVSRFGRTSCCSTTALIDAPATRLASTIRSAAAPSICPGPASSARLRRSLASLRSWLSPKRAAKSPRASLAQNQNRNLDGPDRSRSVQIGKIERLR
jgi:hypothetical protein